MSFPLNKIVCGDALTLLKQMPSESVDVCLTSPPYWGLRDYGVDVQTVWDGTEDCEHEWGIGQSPIHKGQVTQTKYGERPSSSNGGNAKTGSFCVHCGAWRGQLGLEPHPNQYIQHLATIFSEVKRVLKKQGSLWLNMGDTYFSSTSHSDWSWKNHNNEKWRWGNKGEDKFNVKRLNPNGKWLQPKQKMLIPERLAISLQEQGWILRNTVVWFKPNHMPSSVRDRFTNAYENIYFFVKSRRYYFDLDAVRQPHTFSTKERLKQDISKQFKESKSLEISKQLPMKGGGSRKEIPAILQHMKEHLNPKGKNPGDVWKLRKDCYEATTQEKRQFGVSYKNKYDNPKGKNPGDLWTINTQPFKQAHFATFPMKLVTQVLKCACPKDGVVLDPFVGSGTTCYVARKMALNYVGFDLKAEYCEMAHERLRKIPSRLDAFLK